MLDNIINKIISDPVLIYLPLMILVNLILGVAGAIKTKKFTFKKLPDFMTKGVLIFIFMGIITLLSKTTTEAEFGAIAVYCIQGVRGAAWLGAVGYYLYSIYKNLCTLGMPEFKGFKAKVQEMQETAAKDAASTVIEGVTQAATPEESETSESTNNEEGEQN